MTHDPEYPRTATIAEVVRADLDKAMVEMRLKLASEMYANLPKYPAPPPLTRRQRIGRWVRSYLIGWREALGGVWRAARNQDVWPQEDDY